MKSVFFYPAKKLVHYCYDDFTIRSYIFDMVSGIKHSSTFCDKIFLACNCSCHNL